jgi:hypothetical protein
MYSRNRFFTHKHLHLTDNMYLRKVLWVFVRSNGENRKPGVKANIADVHRCPLTMKFLEMSGNRSRNIESVRIIVNRDFGKVVNYFGLNVTLHRLSAPHNFKCIPQISVFRSLLVAEAIHLPLWRIAWFLDTPFRPHTMTDKFGRIISILDLRVRMLVNDFFNAIFLYSLRAASKL